MSMPFALGHIVENRALSSVRCWRESPRPRISRCSAGPLQDCQRGQAVAARFCLPTALHREADLLVRGGRGPIPSA